MVKRDHILGSEQVAPLLSPSSRHPGLNSISNFLFACFLVSVVNRKELNRSFHRTSSIRVAAAICKPSCQLRACELYFLFHIGFSGVILGTFSIKQFGIGLVNTFPHIWNLCYQVSSSEMILQSMHPRCFTLSWSQQGYQHLSRPVYQRRRLSECYLFQFSIL